MKQLDKFRKIAASLDVIDESEDESGLFRDERIPQKKGVKKAGSNLIQLQDMQSPIACNFSDLSSIEHDLLDAFKFVPATGEQCMNSIPLSVSILHDIVDKVVLEDEKKEILARERAIKLAISQAWTTAFNNQFFNDKQRFESLTQHIERDRIEAEEEPVPAKIDTAVSTLPRCKVKVKPMAPKIKIGHLKKPNSQKRYQIRVSPVRRNSSVEFSLSQRNFNQPHGSGNPASARDKKVDFASRRHSSVADLNMLQSMPQFNLMQSLKEKKKVGKIKTMNSVSDLLSGGSFEGSEASTSRRAYTGRRYRRPNAQYRPVLLMDYYSNYEDHTSVCKSEDDDWSSIAIQKKKTIRAQRRLEQKDQRKMDIYGMKSGRENLTKSVVSQMQKRNLNEIVFDSDAFILEKKSDEKIQTDLAMQEARIKREQVQFKFNGPTYIEEEAPGFPVQQSQNRRYQRVLVDKQVDVTLSRKSQISQSDKLDSVMESSKNAGKANHQKRQSRANNSIAVTQESRNLGTDFQAQLNNSKQESVHKSVNKQEFTGLQSEKSTEQKKIDFKAMLKELFLKKLQMSSNGGEAPKEKEIDVPAVKQTVMSQLLKDAFLRKLNAIQKRSVRGSLMPSRLQKQFKSQQMLSMVGYIKPPTIKYKNTKPQFRIDSKTLQMWETADFHHDEIQIEIKQHESEEKFDHLRLRSHRLHKSEEDLLKMMRDDQTKRRNSNELPNRQTEPRVRTKFNPFDKKSATLNEAKINQIMQGGMSRQSSQDRHANTGKALWHEDRRRKVKIFRESCESTETAEPGVAFIEQKSKDFQKDYLSVIMQQQDESENVSPGNVNKRKRQSIGDKKLVLPPLKESRRNYVKSQTSLRTYDKMKINTQHSMSKLMDNPQRLKLGMSQPVSLSSLMQGNSSTPRNRESPQMMLSASKMQEQSRMPQMQQQFSTQFATSQGTLSSKRLDFGTIQSEIVHGKKQHTVRANLLKTIDKPNSYTSKVLIKNLELSKNFVAGVKERKKQPDTSARHAKQKHSLMNVGGVILDFDQKTPSSRLPKQRLF